MNISPQQIPTFKMDGNNMVLLADTIFEKNLILKGNITCEKDRHSLTVNGDIIANNIDVYDIYAHNCIKAKNISAHNITAFDIVARNIDANNINAKHFDANNIIVHHIEAYFIHANHINAENIICDKRTKKTPEARTHARLLVQNRFNQEYKEQIPMEKKK